eukprot:GEMP01066944.1.p1 GENE.GEMP01066944.1~~GEMP01066944.1.p1  ORF type:complete len:249 (+),score=69.63 GEMP01066944.1:71-817(+)
MSTFQFVESEDGFCVAPPKHPGKRAYIYWHRLHFCWLFWFFQFLLGAPIPPSTHNGRQPRTDQQQPSANKSSGSRKPTIISQHAEKIWAKKSKAEIAQIEKEFKEATSKYTSDLRAWLDVYQAQQAKRKLEAAYIYEKYVPQKDGLAMDAATAVAEHEQSTKGKPDPSSPKAQKLKGEACEDAVIVPKDKDENGLKDHLLEMYQKFAANEQKNSVVYDTQALSLTEMEVLKDRFLHPHADGPENHEDD